ncbi:MAG: glycosyltransferase family 39 protein [Patescibacteria group bacterium]
MLIINTMIFFLSILFPGYIITSLIFGRDNKPFLYRLALSYGLGVYFISIQLFLYLFILRLDFSYLFFNLLFIFENIILTVYAIKKGLFKNFIIFGNINIPNFKVKEIIVILLILIQLIFLFSNALSRPVATYDSLTMWAYKAKTLYYEGGISFNQDSPLYLGGGGHINYPWLVPIVQFWLHVNLGEYNDLLINLIFVIYFVCVLILVYFFLKDYTKRFNSLIFVLFLSTMPLFFYHGYNAYADLVLSYYVFASFIFLIKWVDKGRGINLVISGIFSGISFFVKNEAIIFIIASLLLLSLYNCYNRKSKIYFKKIFNYLLFVILIMVPVLVYNIINSLGIKNTESGLGFHPEIFKSFFYVLFQSNSWNIWWFIVAVALIVNIKKIIKDRRLLAGWLYVLLFFVGFIIIYLFTEEYKYAVDFTAVGRSILVIIPVTIAVVGMSFRPKIINKT